MSSIFSYVCERVTGRKARGLQREEIACKCHTFFSLLSARRNQSSNIFSFSIQIQKVSLKILCCHNDTWFHLKLTILKPRDNQCLFLMEMFYAFTPNSVSKSVSPLCPEPTWQTSMLYSDIVTLIYVNETICTVVCLSSRFRLIILWPRINHLVPKLSQHAHYG